MSTKTTFKRVAAVAAAALAIGGLSAVSANAATALGNVELVATSGDVFKATNTAGNSAATAIAGAANSISFTLNTADLSGSYTGKTGGAGIVVVSGGSSSITAAGGEFTLAAGTSPTSATIGDNKTSDNAFTVSTPVVGTITVSYYKLVSTGIYSSTAAESITVTVNAASVAGAVSVGNSTSYITDTTTASVNGDTANAAAIYGAAAVVTADSTLVVSKGTTGTPARVATILVTLKDTQTPTAYGIGGKDLLATVTGPGLVTGTGTGSTTALVNTPARVAYSATQDGSGSTIKGLAAFGVYSDGTAGASTITISYTSAGVTTTIATETLTFYGGVATITPTVALNYVASSGSAWPTGTISHANYAVKLLFADSAGNKVKAAQTITATSGDTAKVSAVTCSQDASATYAGYYYCSVTGVSGASGKVTLTFSVGAASTYNLVTTTADVTVSAIKATTLTITADSSVSAGGLITYTLTAKDAAGNPIADGVSALSVIGSPIVSGGANPNYGSLANEDAAAAPFYNSVGTLFTGVYFDGGVATDTVQAPFGSATVSAKFTNVGTAGVANTALATALNAVVTTVDTTVGGDSAVQAATDAAQEATDAANAAYDAANNAMDSADAATAAAQDASDNASAALAAVTSLAATVAKLVKSIAAITAAVAKIQKKIGA